MIHSGVLFMKNVVKKRAFPLTLITPGSGHIAKNLRMQALQLYLAVDLIRVLHRHTVPMH